MEDCGFLKFTDETLKVSFLQSLNTMRKHRLFCDVVLNVSEIKFSSNKNTELLFTMPNTDGVSLRLN